MIRTLELTADVADFGDQPEYFVSGIKSVSRVGHGVVPVTYYTEREGDQKQVAFHMLWDAQTYFAFAAIAAQEVTRALAIAPPTLRESLAATSH